LISRRCVIRRCFGEELLHWLKRGSAASICNLILGLLFWLAPWLAVIARNRALDVLRKRKPQTEIDETTVSVEPDLAADADRTRVAEKVRSTLKQMPAAQRSALEMAYFEGYSHSEISQKTGEPLGTIKTRIRTGLIMLRKAVEIT